MATGKKRLMTAPVITSRCGIFSPTIRQGKTNWSGNSRWAEVVVKGEITQIHRGVLDAIFGYALDSRILETGEVEILFDPYQIAKVTGSSRDYKWLASKINKSIFKDLGDVMVCVKDIDTGVTYTGGIVSDWRSANVRKSMPGGALTGHRLLMSVTISAVWMRLHLDIMCVEYRELMPAISRLKAGVLQALVRFCLTHCVLNMKLEEVLRHIGAIDDKTSKRTCQRLIKIVNESDLSVFGILIKNNIVFYMQHDQVKFKNPSGDSNCAVRDTT